MVYWFLVLWAMEVIHPGGVGPWTSPNVARSIYEKTGAKIRVRGRGSGHKDW